MADLSKLKRRTTLGAPPPPEEASRNLKAPEIAPVTAAVAVQTASGSDGPVIAPGRPGKGGRVKTPGHQPPARIDGRSLRKSGRTVQFANRVSWEFDERLRHIAQRDGLLLVEVLEMSLDAYEARKNRS